MANIPFENVPRIGPLDPISAGNGRTDADILPFDQVLQQPQSTPRPDIESEPARAQNNDDQRANEEPSTPISDTQPQDDTPPEQAESADADDSNQGNEGEEDSQQSDESNEQEEQQDDQEATVANNTTDQTESDKAIAHRSEQWSISAMTESPCLRPIVNS